MPGKKVNFAHFSSIPNSTTDHQQITKTHARNDSSASASSSSSTHPTSAENPQASEVRHDSVTAPAPAITTHDEKAARYQAEVEDEDEAETDSAPPPYQADPIPLTPIVPRPPQSQSQSLPFPIAPRNPVSTPARLEAYGRHAARQNPSAGRRCMQHLARLLATLCATTIGAVIILSVVFLLLGALILVKHYFLSEHGETDASSPAPALLL